MSNEDMYNSSCVAQVAHPLLERVSALTRTVQGWSVPVRGMLCCNARRTSSECPTSRRFCFQLPMRSDTCPVQVLMVFLFLVLRESKIQ